MKSWFKITNNSARKLTIDILDEIGAWGITAKMFVEALARAGKPTEIIVNIDCPGGDCNDGFTILDALKNSGATITVNIIGMAASMASVIMLAGKTINIAENGRIMIHRVTAGAMGNADDVAAAAVVMKQFEDRIVSLYIARTSKEEAAIRDMMKSAQGTWFFGQDAVDNGFADKVITGTKAKAFNGQWARLFTMLPSALFDSAPPSDPPTPPRKPSIMTNAQKTRFRALLALAKRTAEEETELGTLQALATTAGYDNSMQKADADADTITALNARLATLEGTLKAAQDKLDAEAKAKADADAKAKDPTELLKRLETMENLIKSGVLASAGGTAPIGGAGGKVEGDTTEVPKNEAELRAAMAKLESHEARSALLKAYKARTQK